MHGGAIAVESRVGAGSRFSVGLPRDPRLVEGSPAAEQADVASAAAADARLESAEPAEAAAEGDGAGSTAVNAYPGNMQETSPTERSQVNTEAAP
jgi:hypothetical protein